MEIQITNEEVKNIIVPEIINKTKHEIMEEVRQMKWNVKEELKKEILQQHLTGWGTKELNTEFKELLLKEVKEVLNNLIQEKINAYVNSEKKNIDYCIMRAIDEKADKVLKEYIFIHNSALP